MCAPALGAVVGIVGAIAQFQAQSDDYNAKKAAWEQNVVNAEASARDEHRQITNRFLQEQEKTTQKKHVSFIEEAQKGATAQNNAASAGVSGASVDNIVRDIAGKSALNRTYADKNYQFVAADLSEQMKATDTRLKGRIESMPVPQAPSPLGLIAGIAGAGVKAVGGLGM
jgi:hypothetical protein